MGAAASARGRERGRRRRRRAQVGNRKRGGGHKKRVVEKERERGAEGAHKHTGLRTPPPVLLAWMADLPFPALPFPLPSLDLDAVFGGEGGGGGGTCCSPSMRPWSREALLAPPPLRFFPRVEGRPRAHGEGGGGTKRKKPKRKGWNEVLESGRREGSSTLRPPRALCSMHHRWKEGQSRRRRAHLRWLRSPLPLLPRGRGGVKKVCGAKKRVWEKGPAEGKKAE